jgi:L-fuculose-phosphate aldolase
VDIDMINEFKIKQDICEVGHRLYAKGFAAANDGNITVRLNDKEILCTPTMVSKGFMKPDDICKVDYEGKQLAGKRKRTSEVLVHLAVYKNRPDVHAVVHCHPPHATAFAVAHEPIPKCILPEVEVFLGEVPIAIYETPGDNRLPQTIVPYVKDCNTILLANHGTVTWGPDVEKAYFNSEIIDAYCKILLLAKQLGRVNYFSEGKTKELMEFKKRIGYDDPRLHEANCELCGPSVFDEGYSDFVPEAYAFRREGQAPTIYTTADGSASEPGNDAICPLPGKAEVDIDEIVRRVTDQVMAALAG